MPHAGQELHGHGGYVLRLVEIGDDLLEMEARYGAESAMPPEHIHPSQDEHFEILEGSVRTVIDGVDRTFAAGEAFDVPARTPHTMAGVGAARMRWQVRPALRTAEFFERLYTGRGLETLFDDFSAEFRLPPASGDT